MNYVKINVATFYSWVLFGLTSTSSNLQRCQIYMQVGGQASCSRTPTGEAVDTGDPTQYPFHLGVKQPFLFYFIFYIFESTGTQHTPQTKPPPQRTGECCGIHSLACNAGDVWSPFCIRLLEILGVCRCNWLRSRAGGNGFLPHAAMPFVCRATLPRRRGSGRCPICWYSC